MTSKVIRYLLALAPLPFSAAPALAQDTGPAVSNSGLEDIVVTAQKREQNLQAVPISITAITAASITANRIQDVRDLSAIAPNLSIRISGGGAQAPIYVLRGLLTNGTAAGTDKGVSLYLDGVYMQNVQGSVFDFADIERIEVLKGPQGTLFGRNATGGAISIITRNPTGEFNVKQELTYGNYDQLRSKTRVDLPRFGPFSISASYLHSERDGDIRNLGAGTVWDYGPAGGPLGKVTSPKYLGSDNVEAATVAVKADLHPDIDLVYKYDYSENHYTPNGQGVGFIPSDSFLIGLRASSPNPQTPLTTDRPKAVNNAYTIPSFTRNQGHNLTAKYQATDEISFKNILAYRKSSIYGAFQLDGVGGLVNAIAVPGFGTFPIDATAPTSAPLEFLVNNFEQKERQWSNEFQININTDWFSLTAGYLHFYDSVATAGFEGQFNTTVVRGVAGQGTSANGTPFTILGNPGYEHTRVKVNSDAFFVQPEIHITDRIDIVGGARITKDRKKGIEFVPNQSTLPAGAPNSSLIAYRRSQATYLAGINYRPVDNILVYGKFATGYISGGRLATITFAPETAKSWEGGIKSDLFDRHFRSNVSVFHVDYGNIQQTPAGFQTGVPSAALYSQAVVASGNAKAKGFEWENTLAPVEGLVLTANVGYTDFKFDQSTIFPGLLDQAGAPGYREFGRPKWTGNLSAQYETTEVVAGGHFLFRVDGNFRSKQLLLADITPGAANDPASPFYNPALPTVLRSQVLEDPALRKAATVPFQWLVNARVALVNMEFGRAKATVALWGRNILDNDHATQFINFGPVSSTIYERARTYGLDVSFEF